MIPDRDRPIATAFTSDKLLVTLANKRQITISLSAYPSLVYATSAQRSNIQFSLAGLYWPDLNLDISLLELLGATSSAPRRHKPHFCEG